MLAEGTVSERKPPRGLTFNPYFIPLAPFHSGMSLDVRLVRVWLGGLDWFGLVWTERLAWAVGLGVWTECFVRCECFYGFGLIVVDMPGVFVSGGYW